MQPADGNSTPGSERSVTQQGGKERGNNGGWFFDNGGGETTGESGPANPISGDGWQQWADRLRNVEDALNRPELRNQAAQVLDEARRMRIDSKRNDEPPQVDHLKLRVVKPLVELRDRITEEIAQRDTKRPQFQLDASPVPERYRELVRRYAEQLGAGN